MTMLTANSLCAVAQAWSAIVRSIVPNLSQLDACAKQLGDLLDANEVVLFHRIIYLVSNNAFVLSPK